MELLRSFVFLFVLHLLQGCNSSLVQLKDNGYEGIIIAIHPTVPENEILIKEIQDMMTEASTYLFKATENRIFFKNVNILIPDTWKNKPQYGKPRHESYPHANVIVAPPTSPGRDEPYTRHFKQCGENGEYIHLTPDFLLGNKKNEYGSSGRLLVHEWAHLRWGVFDEYNEHEPFYAAANKKIEATRCSKDIKGKNGVYMDQGSSSILRPCRFNSTTKLYEKDCQFFPDKEQTAKTSIMFMQAIDSVIEFCNKKTHNREAPTPQNKKCDSNSTWEVIRISEDIKNTMSMMTPPPPPVFSLLRVGERIVCLVLDKSSSMRDYDRLIRMNQAAKHFLWQVVENGSWVGIVVFESSAVLQSKLIQIKSQNDRDTLVNKLPPIAAGGTSICSGIRLALQEIKSLYPQVNGSEIVLLTDGENNSPIDCTEEMVRSGAILHLIALGPKADKNVTEMSVLTGGKHIFSTDVLENNGLLEAFSALTSENAPVSEKSLQLESRGKTLSKGDWMNDTVIIDSSVGKDTFFVITWKQASPLIFVRDPSGINMEPFKEDRTSKMASLNITGIAEAGIWTYNLQSNADQETLTITVNSRAANSFVPPITVSAKVNNENNSFPETIVYAEVLQGFTPILGAKVTAIIESESESTTLELLDNGAGADSNKDDGVYSRYFTNYKLNGRYNLKVKAQRGETAIRSLKHSPNTAAFIPGWVVNGEIQGNPPRPEVDQDIQPNLEDFSRTASGGAFVLSNIPDNYNPSTKDYFPPSKITDLEATRDGNTITLTWTAPGDDFDVGKAQQYKIRKSKNILDLKDNFDGAEEVSTKNLIPKEANSKEIFVFEQENVTEENATHMFFAIRSVDDSNLSSEISNIVQVALFTPQADDVPEENHFRINTFTVVMVVVGSVAIVSIIVSTTVCVLSRKRSSNRPSTGF
ncbi:calcium-activated chloride channel regulator 4-like [Suncus etruscus]|uniref:calcium-activated chloride channel regulator 4-like n=1 Tax=Suncus etruscus TaxID=109475 RepID=UPI00210F9E43|nr:calcium-activated chloride channel regulator 4-like [Suncus etruscus]